MSTYIIKGGQKLSGSVTVSGAKNAALPILCAALLTAEKCVIKNVPDIADIHLMIKIIKHLGCKVTFEKNTVTINAKNLKSKYLSSDLVCHMRASILLMGPLLARFSKVKMSYPGGCVLGKRPIDAHLKGFEGIGAKVVHSNSDIELKATKLIGNDITLPEMSVTATENLVMAAVLTKGETIIRLAAAEPHVQDLCKFLNKLGAKIKGIGTHTLKIKGVKKLKGTEYKVTGDYLEAGTLTLAAILTNGKVTIKGIDPHQLDSFWQKLKEVGANFKLRKNEIKVFPHKKLSSGVNLRTAVFPSFPTDLQAPFTVLLTQAKGEHYIHETLFEGRLNYLVELENMGTKVEILNPHQAIVFGPVKLKGTKISSHDIRAGAAMVLAALVAKGTTEIGNIRYIDRGYERLEEKLTKLGAIIKRK